MQSDIVFRLKPFVIGEDYPEICEWWRKHGWVYVPIEFLSQTGFVVCDGNFKCCAAWLWDIPGSSWMMFDFLVSNPASPPRKTKMAIDFLLDNMKVLVGKKMGFTMTKTKSLIRLYEKHGFINKDSGMSFLTFTGASL